MNTDDGSCDINPCAAGTDDCDDNGVCAHTGPGRHVCACSEGYVGDGVTCAMELPGCMDALAFNYMPAANTDDSSCVAVVRGCTSASAFNYAGAAANVDDGSCVDVVRLSPPFCI